MAIFQRLNREGATIVLVTHEHDIAMHTHRIIAFRDGFLVKDDPVTDPVDAADMITRLTKMQDELM